MLLHTQTYLGEISKQTSSFHFSAKMVMNIMKWNVLVEIIKHDAIFIRLL